MRPRDLRPPRASNVLSRRGLLRAGSTAILTSGCARPGGEGGPAATADTTDPGTTRGESSGEATSAAEVDGSTQAMGESTDDTMADTTGADGPPIDIMGDAWCPHVDDEGQVLPSDIAQLPLNRWLFVKTNTVGEVVGPEAYPTSVSGADGRHSIMSAWCGAAHDYVRGIMYVSGGGHADSHLCENGVYAFDSRTMRWSEAMPRSARRAQQKYYPGQGYVSLPEGDPRAESGNCPMADGAPPATHTFDAMWWFPDELVGNQRGALLMFAGPIHVLDLDTQTYDVAHHDVDTVDVDLSYKIMWADGWNVVHARASFYYRLWDVAPTTREPTTWSEHIGQPDSRGTFVKSFDAGTMFPYNHKMMCKMPRRREVVVIGVDGTVGGVIARRVRYGDAFDAGNTESWGEFSDPIALTSNDGSSDEFTAPSMMDQDLDSALYAAGMAHDATGNRIWVVSNLEGGSTYEITGLDGSRWTVRRLEDPANLTSSSNGTFERVQCIDHSGHTLLIRATQVDGFTEVMRVT